MWMMTWFSKTKNWFPLQWKLPRNWPSPQICIPRSANALPCAACRWIKSLLSMMPRLPEARAKLFAAVNKGTIRVLLGSTEKMGTGMNVQERCIAMHTITPPWRPGDIEQQVGRVLRQGNLFPQVFQFVHITEGSFDGYVWQLLENKAGFIDQLSRGDVNTREIEDVSDTVLTFSEIKALASGNPLIMQKVVLEADYQRLSAVRSSWQSSKNRLFSDVRYSEQKRARTEEDIAALKEAARIRDANTPEKFSIDLLKSINDDSLYTEKEREAAGKQIITLAKFAAAKVTGATRTQNFIVIGKYRGFDLCATASMLDDQGSAIPYLYFKINGETAQITADTEIGVTRSMDMRLKGIDALLANKEAMLPSDRRRHPSCHAGNQPPVGTRAEIQ